MRDPVSPDRQPARPSAFVARLRGRWDTGAHLCVGLDPLPDRFPPPFADQFRTDPEAATVAFLTAVIDATHESVAAYKPNAAYFEALGQPGHRALVRVVAHVRSRHPEITVLLDAKRADIGETNAAYATACFDVIGADAVTVHPWFGGAALEPFLSRRDKGIIVMAANSNPGAGEFQDLLVGDDRVPLAVHVADRVATGWNRHGNCGVTVGATNPARVRAVRAAAGDMPLLVLGVGAQGGDLAETVRAGRNRAGHGHGLIISTSRAVLYAGTGGDAIAAAGRSAAKFNAAIARALHESD